MNKAQLTETAPFFYGYLTHVADADVLQQLRDRAVAVRDLYGSVPPAKHDFAYAEGKWTVKQVLGHVTDTERIMAYRALCIARGEAQYLPGFDENAYVTQANFAQRTLADLLDEFAAVRASSVLLFQHLPSTAHHAQGVASERPITVRALASIIVGHEMHHSHLLRERYL